jgi:hypothetical protein
MARMLIVAAALVAPVTLSGCARIMVSQRLDELKAQLDPLMGHTQEDVVMQLGPPDRVQELGDLTVYSYRRSYGYAANASAHGDTAYASSRERYDSFNIYFRNGVAKKWDGYVQR